MVKTTLFVLIGIFAFLYCKSQTKDNIYFSESFDDANLESRGWYDGVSSRISAEARKGEGCIEYEWVKGDRNINGSSQKRHLLEPVNEVYIRFYLKLSKGWQWSGRNYHPHLTHFMTTENSEYHGPAASHLTLYIYR